MNRSGPVILLVITAAISSACGLFGPSESATGLWEARGPTHIPPFVYLNLQQSGDIITGTACYVSGGVVLYTAAPVTGRYPNVTYVVTETSGCARPLCEGVLGDRWTGKIDKTGDIVPTDPDGLRFRRTSTQPAACERGSR